MKFLALMISAILCAVSMLFAGFFAFVALATGDVQILAAAIACIVATGGSAIAIAMTENLPE